MMNITENEKQEILDRIVNLENSIKESEKTENLLLSSNISNSEASTLRRFYNQLNNSRLEYINELQEFLINCAPDCSENCV